MDNLSNIPTFLIAPKRANAQATRVFCVTAKVRPLRSPGNYCAKSQETVAD